MYVFFMLKIRDQEVESFLLFIDSNLVDQVKILETK
jgi:hypothetical protein